MFVLAAFAALQISARADTPPTSGLILIDDVERFYRVYDAARSSPTAERPCRNQNFTLTPVSMDRPDAGSGRNVAPP
jgi:hypothetical protein